MSNQFIGLLSGTSADAIDAILASFDDDKCQLICAESYKIPIEIQQNIIKANYNKLTLFEFSELDSKLGYLFAKAANNLIAKNNIDLKQIKGIGLHGQTIYHEPNGQSPNSIQIGNPAIVNNETKLIVIADLRRQDMAAGGQGAPLATSFHHQYLRSNTKNRVIINIGGIANLTYLPINNSAQNVIGFDTGPGNCLMDEWIQLNLNKPYDNNGDWASSGKIDTYILEKLLADPFFHKLYPKSTGREYFNLNWVYSTINQNKCDQTTFQTTLCELTAQSIYAACKQLQKTIDEIYICGGGAKNSYLMERLSYLFNEIPVNSTQAINFDPSWIEGMTFAWLAKQRLENKPGNIPAVTGAKKSVVLGAIYSN